MSDDTTLVIEREFEASPERIYEAWTTPEILQRWWGPEGVGIPDLDLDVREGGAWTTTMKSDQGERIVSGKYVTLEPPNRLVFTWGWIDNGTRGQETEVEIVLIKAGAKTTMILTQKVFADVENRNNHQFGWKSSFKKLEQLLAS